MKRKLLISAIVAPFTAPFSLFLVVSAIDYIKLGTVAPMWLITEFLYGVVFFGYTAFILLGIPGLILLWKIKRVTIWSVTVLGALSGFLMIALPIIWQHYYHGRYGFAPFWLPSLLFGLLPGGLSGLSFWYIGLRKSDNNPI